VSRTYRAQFDHDVNADPQAVFSLVTDPERFPAWNAHIDHIIDAPPQLALGSEWVVHIKAMGSSWPSRAKVVRLDPEALRFDYVSMSDDGNPSRGTWTWTLAPTGTGTHVHVEYELVPKTFWRRALLARIRHPVLRKEVAESLGEIDRVLTKEWRT
jgi:uncharacterized protein YndB with AHSA1/START domain